MALTKRYARLGLTTGNNDGTTWANAWKDWSDVTTNLDTDLDASASGIELQLGAEGTNDADNRYSLGATTSLDAGNITKSLNISGVTAEDTPGFIYLSATGITSLVGPYYIELIDLESSTSGAAIGMSGGSLLRRSRVCNTNGLGEGVQIASGAGVIDSVIETQGATGNNTIECQRGTCINNLIRTNSIGIKVTVGRGQSVILGNVIVPYDTSATYGIEVDLADAYQGYFIQYNRIYNMTHGIYITDMQALGQTYSYAPIYRNIIYTCSAYGIFNADATDTATHWCVGNMIGDCTTARYGGFATDMPFPEDVDLSADPYTNAGSEDLSLNDTAGGGADCRATGFPINMAYDWTNTQDEPVFEGGAGGGETSHTFLG